MGFLKEEWVDVPGCAEQGGWGAEAALGLDSVTVLPSGGSVGTAMVLALCSFRGFHGKSNVVSYI